jgi:hypothetical protein
MNLLNVRFYLYERVIYHPTKCAAGSMLGTALQFLGWRGGASTGVQPILPHHLRFVGDDVFLHDIRGALDFVLERIGQITETNSIGASDLEEIGAMDRVHNGLVLTLLELRIGQPVPEVHRELVASKLMLDRLAARRYFRPVWRALPSSNDPRLQAGAESLADLFRQATIRYEAERQIETNAGLPLGTVTIHCPERTTARKIANVLLTRPGPDGDEICKLKDIGSLDGPIFGEHQKAVKAVEQMYGSMWRLTVYVAPEHLVQYKKIADAAGQVVFRTADLHGQFEDRSEIMWNNDCNLQKELESKLDSTQSSASPEDSELSPLGELVGRLSDRLLRSGRPSNLAITSPDEIERIEKALLTALNPGVAMPDAVGIEPDGGGRIGRLVQLLKTHSKRVKRDELADFEHRYAPALSGLSKGVFEEVFTQMELAVTRTGELDQQGATVHKGTKLDQFREAVDDLLRKHGVMPLPRIKNDLFGGAK